MDAMEALEVTEYVRRAIILYGCQHGKQLLAFILKASLLQILQNLVAMPVSPQGMGFASCHRLTSQSFMAEMTSLAE